MLTHPPFAYTPSESERESASNSYLMSLIAIMAGIPLPVMNLLATGIFYLGNRKSGYFTRWHCTQAMLSQITMFVVNITSVSWVLAILFGPANFSNAFVAWLIVALLVNLTEFALTIYTAIVTRKGVHVSWWFWGTLTDLVCKPLADKTARTPADLSPTRADSARAATINTSGKQDQGSSSPTSSTTSSPQGPTTRSSSTTSSPQDPSTPRNPSTRSFTHHDPNNPQDPSTPPKHD